MAENEEATERRRSGSSGPSDDEWHLNGTGKPIEPDEALSQIMYLRHLIESTRIAASGSYPWLLLWGVIWIAGHTGALWSPRIWLILLPIGFVASALLGWMVGERAGPTSPLLVQIAWMNVILFVVMVGLSILVVQERQSAVAFWPIAFGIMYLLNGIFLGREFLFIGAWLVGAGTLSLFLPLEAAHIWMAIAGGGGLLASGVVLRRRFQRRATIT